MIQWTNRIEYHAPCEEFTQTTIATQKKIEKSEIRMLTSTLRHS
jgi:hypothetical protein